MKELDNNNIPKHVAIIMDGNGRWAKQQNKLRIFGHTNGVAAVRRAVSYARQTGVNFWRYLRLAVKTGIAPSKKWVHWWRSL